MALTAEEKMLLSFLFEGPLFFKRANNKHKSLVKRGFIRRLPKADVRAAGYRQFGAVGFALSEAGLMIVSEWMIVPTKARVV